MRIALYTCVTGQYDFIRQPRFIDPRIEFFCFTDDASSVASPWIPRDAPIPGSAAKDRNRYAKLLPHVVLPGYDATIYIDGNIELISSPFDMAVALLSSKSNLFAYDHPFRNCVYLEAIACMHFGHDWLWKINQQMSRYMAEGFPRNAGLFEANILIRRSGPLQKTMELWWDEYRNGVKRDQLSLPYASWKTSHPIFSMGPSDARTSHQYFKLHDHRVQPKMAARIRKYVNRGLSALPSTSDWSRSQ